MIGEALAVQMAMGGGFAMLAIMNFVTPEKGTLGVVLIRVFRAVTAIVVGQLVAFVVNHLDFLKCPNETTGAMSPGNQTSLWSY